PVWDHVLALVTGMMLAPGKHTVSAALRVVCLGQARHFARYHHVLSRARWDSAAIGGKLLLMILDRFLPAGRVVIGINDTIERRWGHKIAASGIYRERLALADGDGHGSRAMDPATLGSAVSHHPRSFRTLRRRAHRRRHKKLTDWARQ